MRQCVGIFILVNSLGCVSEQGLKMLGLLKLIHLAEETEKSSQNIIIKSLVRPVVEYACPVQSTLIKEKLQCSKRKHTMKSIKNKPHMMSYKERSKFLGWSTLEC